MKRVGLLLAGCATLMVTAVAHGQSYQPRETFAPFDMGQPVNRYRSGSGRPGPDYWQNRADYEIHATLDTATKTISGTTTITYTNNSPDTLTVLWLQLDQNLYAPNSRGRLANGGSRPTGTTDGMTLDSVAFLDPAGKPVSAIPLVTDTRAQLALPKPLAPGGKATVTLRYHYTVPGAFGGRTSWGRSRDAEIYDIAQWYPRMAVYDDIRGWDTAPYLAQEFYLEYGNFDYWITVPSNMLVAGSGALVNPADVLSTVEQERLARARTSDATVMIRSPAEVAEQQVHAKTGGVATWHFRMENTRDVAFSASSGFVWDAARINLPDGKTALAQSVYPAESQGADKWGRSTEYLKDSVERFSARWFSYPWPNAINVAGPTSGMEYPGIIFDGPDDAGKTLFWITAHEIGHGWFPMIVGFDERRNAWMDEGFNTFIDVYQSDDFNHGEYAPKRDSEFAEAGGNPVDAILPLLADKDAPPILSRSDTVTEAYRHPVTYFKSALGLVLLREQILGPARFDPAFRHFIADWAFRHPKPADFFRAMESEAGEDLSWWWRGWYANTWQLDLAIVGVDQGSANPAHAAVVQVASLDKLVLPATLRITYSDGKVVDMRLPAETWIRQGKTGVAIPSSGKIVRAEIDPDHKIPDRDRTNNVWTGPSDQAR